MARRSRVSRMRKTRRFINRLPKEIRQDLRSEMEWAGDALLQQAQDFAPVESGTLRDALSVRRSSDRLTAEVGVIRKRAKRKAFYAAFVEFGTVNAPAQPFLGPAMESLRPVILARVGAALRKTIQRAARLGAAGE